MAELIREIEKADIPKVKELLVKSSQGGVL